METLKISKENALAAFNEASPKGKKLLTNLFGVHVFITDIRERIQNFDDVLELNGIEKNDFARSCEGLTADEVAYRKIKLIVLAYNQGWTPDWSDSNQYKYYPWFKWTAAAGSAPGFSYIVFAYAHSRSYLGSRLVYKSSELAIDAGQKFESVYSSFLKP